LDLVAASLIPNIAEWACRASTRLEFRLGVLERLVPVLQLEAAAFATFPPSPGGETVAVRNTSVRRVVALWSEEEARMQIALRRPPLRLVTGPPIPDWSASGRELNCCLLRVGSRPLSALSLSRVRPFSAEELRFLGELQPVLRLGDERHQEVSDSLGARLSPRERQIFDFLVRGFRNEDIARALGTSPATVRNQLVRLYRKAGVATRSELVGLLSSRSAVGVGGAA
jgi:DNA-binding CsgD family transcriptional regulator